MIQKNGISIKEIKTVLKYLNDFTDLDDIIIEKDRVGLIIRNKNRIIFTYDPYGIFDGINNYQRAIIVKSTNKVDIVSLDIIVDFIF